MANINLKLAAFEYSILSMANWAVSMPGSGYRNISDFSFFNNFGKERILLYPFFLATANGNRREMFKLFDNFIAEDFGHCDKDLLDAFQKEMGFKTFHAYADFIEIVDEVCGVIDSNDFKRTAKEIIEKFYQFEQSVEREKFSKFINEIDHSIDSLKKRSDGDFITYDGTTLSSYSRHHNSWSVLRFLEIKDKNVISEILIQEPSMFRTVNLSIEQLDPQT